MEQTQTPDVPQGTALAAKFFAAAVSLDVFVAILNHWKGFDRFDRFLAAFIVLILIMVPARATWGGKRPASLEWPNLFLTYVILLMTTSLFSR
jgi:hypothetical protein